MNVDQMTAELNFMLKKQSLDLVHEDKSAEHYTIGKIWKLEKDSSGRYVYLTFFIKNKQTRNIDLIAASKHKPLSRYDVRSSSPQLSAADIGNLRRRETFIEQIKGMF